MPRSKTGLLQPFLHDRGGSVGVLFALMLLPLLGFVGLATDVGMKLRAQTEVQAAADSAALVATTNAAKEYAAGTTTWQADSQAAGLNFFNAQITDISYLSTSSNGASGASLTVVQASPGSNTFNATLTYTATMNTAFARLLGQSTFQVSSGSYATSKASSYIDFHFLVDNSSSMLIGATQADMTNLANDVQSAPYSSWDGYSQHGQSQTCAFGCHFSTSTGTYQQANGNGAITVPQDFYGVAQVAGVTLRLNVVQGAIANVINTIAQAVPPNSSPYRVALYAFNDPTQNNQNGVVDSPITVHQLDSNFQTAITQAQDLAVPLTYDNNYEQDTDIPNSINYVTGKIPSSNESGVAGNPREYLFLITDGVEDYGSRTMAPLSPSSCQALKNQGVQIYVLDTVYIPITSNSFYNQNIAPFAGSWVSQPPTPPPSTTLSQDLQACASSASTFFVATDSTDINAQMQNMLQAALGSAGRLTQ